VPRGKPGVPIRLNETRLLSEYLAARWTHARILIQPRVGLLNPEGESKNVSWAELRFMGIWRRYPDAVCITPRRVTIIETSLKPNPAKISLLELYRDLWLVTEDYAEFRSLPVDLLMVWSLPDTATEALARRHGVAVEIFRPAWVDEWLQTLLPRERRAARIT